jgi:hypothetical protein
MSLTWESTTMSHHGYTTWHSIIVPAGLNATFDIRSSSSYIYRYIDAGEYGICPHCKYIGRSNNNTTTTTTINIMWLLWKCNIALGIPFCMSTTTTSCCSYSYPYVQSYHLVSWDASIKYCCCTISLENPVPYTSTTTCIEGYYIIDGPSIQSYTELYGHDNWQCNIVRCVCVD